MSLNIRLQCDRCGGVSPLTHYGTPTDARVSEFKYGWFYDVTKGIPADQCPMCTERDPNYWHQEPF